MKPIKFLLSLFAAVLVTVSVWGQGALRPPVNPSGVQCGGGLVAVGTITPDTLTGFAAGCATVAIFADLVDLSGNVVSTTDTAGITSVTAGSLGAPAAPTAAAVPTSVQKVLSP
jgi:hypothetical protein